MIRSARSNIRMSYKNGSHAILNVPQYIDKQGLDTALEKLSEWLTKLYRKDPELFSPPKSSIGDGQTVMIMGQSYTLHYQSRDHEYMFRARKKEDQIYIEIPEKHLGNPDAMSKVFPLMVNKLFLKAITERVIQINQATLNVKINKVSLRHNKSKWGSCSHTNNISLSTNLLLAPDHIINHVILHELAHVVHKDHSDNFWRLVAQYDKNWRENDAWLNRHGRKLNY